MPFKVSPEEQIRLERPYREWRQGLGLHSVGDVDQIEWRILKRRPDAEAFSYPVAVIELTSCKVLAWPCIKSAMERICKPKGSGYRLRYLAGCLGCEPYVVFYAESGLSDGLAVVHMKGVTEADKADPKPYTLLEWAARLKSLKPRDFK